MSDNSDSSGPRWVEAEQPGLNMSFESKWESVFSGEGEAADFTSEEYLKGFAVLMRRVDHIERQRQLDRLAIEELKRENTWLRRKLAKIVTAAGTCALFCRDAPSWESLKVEANQPRDMSIPEAQWLQEQMEKIPKHDARLTVITRVTGIRPDAKGVLEVDLKELPSRQKWTLYYMLKHDKLIKRPKLGPRGEKKQIAIASAMSAMDMRVTPRDASDVGDEEDEELSAEFDLFLGGDDDDDDSV